MPRGRRRSRGRGSRGHGHSSQRGSRRAPPWDRKPKYRRSTTILQAIVAVILALVLVALWGRRGEDERISTPYDLELDANEGAAPSFDDD